MCALVLTVSDILTFHIFTLKYVKVMKYNFRNGAIWWWISKYINIISYNLGNSAIFAFSYLVRPFLFVTSLRKRCSQVAKMLKKITYMDSSISDQIVQVAFFYSLTLTLIFKVNVWLFFCFAIISQTVRDKSNITIAIRSEIMYLPSNGALRLLYIMTFTYIFKVTNFKMWVSRYMNGSRKRL